MKALGTALAGALLSGCAPAPILDYASTDPAQLLAPIGAAGVEDGRARFREIFCERFAESSAPAPGSASCSPYLHRLADEPTASGTPASARISLQSVRFVVVPGYLGDAAPGGVRAFDTSIKRLAAKGYRIEYMQVSGGGGGRYNAAQIASSFRGRAIPEQERLVLIGYSKGIIDVLHFVVEYPELSRHVDAVVSYAGAVNGSPLAELYPELLTEIALAMGGGDAGDAAGFASLKPAVQMSWLAHHPLPADVSYYSLAAFTNRDNVSSMLIDSYDRLAQINPKNDGHLLFYDQVLPGSTLLGYCNGDHWAVAMPFTEGAGLTASLLATRNVFPRDAMLEAVLLYVRENL